MYPSRYRKVTGAQKSAYFSKAAGCVMFSMRAGKPANPRRCSSMKIRNLFRKRNLSTRAQLTELLVRLSGDIVE